ncbi:MAG TPA: glycosyltransferase [Actinomycetota bacterium]|nr:glycosyltransferase [Actinomycetota bacterium]
MDSKPVVSVTIPTKNSATKHSMPTFERCLESVVSQGVPVEIVVADDESTDGTVDIARSFGARVVGDARPLLQARYEAFRASRGDIVIMLDSDQLLEEGALSRCLEAMREHDVLVLGERSAEGGGWISRLYAADKRLLHRRADFHMDPKRASLLPRVFRRSVLEQAFASIPERLRRAVLFQDHIMIHKLVMDLSPSVGIVPDAVRHLEMDTLRELWRKYYRWGAQLPMEYRDFPEFRTLNRRQVASRFGSGGVPMSDRLQAYLLVVLKAVPYGLGFLKGRLSWRLSSTRSPGRSVPPNAASS